MTLRPGALPVLYVYLLPLFVMPLLIPHPVEHYHLSLSPHNLRNHPASSSLMMMMMMTTRSFLSSHCDLLLLQQIYYQFLPQVPSTKVLDPDVGRIMPTQARMQSHRQIKPWRECGHRGPSLFSSFSLSSSFVHYQQQRLPPRFALPSSSASTS